MQVGQNNADGVRATAAEAACGVMRGVTQFVGDADDAASNGVGYVDVAIQRARDGRDRDVRPACNVLDGDRVAHRIPVLCG